MIPGTVMRDSDVFTPSECSECGVAVVVGIQNWSSSMVGREGTKKRRSKLPPVPSYKGKLVRRADARARIAIDTDKDFGKLDAASGVLLLVEALFDDGFEVVAAEVYAVHPQYRFVDVHLRAPLPANANRVEVKRTSLGVIP